MTEEVAKPNQNEATQSVPKCMRELSPEHRELAHLPLKKLNQERSKLGEADFRKIKKARRMYQSWSASAKVQLRKKEKMQQLEDAVSYWRKQAEEFQQRLDQLSNPTLSDKPESS